MLRKRKVLVAVTGGIAAYKSCELVRLLMKSGASVGVIMTEAATRFVSPLTFEALTGRKVTTDMFAFEGADNPECVPACAAVGEFLYFYTCVLDPHLSSPRSTEFYFERIFFRRKDVLPVSVT